MAELNSCSGEAKGNGGRGAASSCLLGPPYSAGEFTWMCTQLPQKHTSLSVSLERGLTLGLA